MEVATRDGARRILVYGVTGSGKTTLAAKIAECTGLPHVAVDDLTWEANWTPVPDDQQARRIAEVCAGEAWVLDSAYAKWLAIPLARVECIVALDYPRWVSLGRLIVRTAARATDGKPVCNGNRESWRLALSRDSIVGWHFKSFANKRRRIAEMAANPDLRVLRFRRPRDADRWIRAGAP